MQPQYVAIKRQIRCKADVNESQNRRLRRHRFFFRNLSAIVPAGYHQVTNNSSMRRSWLEGCVSVIANSRRLGCPKQYWPSACSWLLQPVHNKKKLYTLKTQWLLKSQQLSTKNSLERACLPVPNHPSAKNISWLKLYSQVSKPAGSKLITAGQNDHFLLCDVGIYVDVKDTSHAGVKNCPIALLYKTYFPNSFRRYLCRYNLIQCVPSVLLPFSEHAPSRKRYKGRYLPSRSIISMATQSDVEEVMDKSLQSPERTTSQDAIHASRKNALKGRAQWVLPISHALLRIVILKAAMNRRAAKILRVVKLLGLGLNSPFALNRGRPAHIIHVATTSRVATC